MREKVEHDYSACDSLYEQCVNRLIIQVGGRYNDSDNESNASSSADDDYSTTSDQESISEQEEAFCCEQ